MKRSGVCAVCAAGLVLVVLAGCPRPPPDPLGIRGEWAVDRLFRRHPDRFHDNHFVEGVTDPTYARLAWDFRSNGRIYERFWVDEDAMAATGATEAEIREAAAWAEEATRSAGTIRTLRYTIDASGMMVTFEWTPSDPAQDIFRVVCHFFFSEAGPCRYWEWWDDPGDFVLTLRRCE